jgi:hypothetical protein
MSDNKTHFRKAFDSPYLSSADIVEATTLTVKRVTLELDRTKKTKDLFNTAHFAERELRPGEKLKPMILNATNSKMLRDISGSPFIEDWCDLRVTVYVDHNVKFGREVTEGLRIMPLSHTAQQQDLAREHQDAIAKAATVAELQEVGAGIAKLPASLKGSLRDSYAARLVEIKGVASQPAPPQDEPPSHEEQPE